MDQSTMDSKTITRVNTTNDITTPYRRKYYKCEKCNKRLSKFRYNEHANVCQAIPRKYRTGQQEGLLRVWCLQDDCSLGRNAVSFPYTTLCSHFRKYHSQPENLDYSCDKCGMNFPIKVMADQHHRKMHDKSHQCSYCDHRFQAKRDLKKHEYTHRKVPEQEKGYKCKFCDFKSHNHTVKHAHELNKHDVTGKFHKHICHICGKRLLYKNKLDLHLRSHSKDKHYACLLCGHEYKTEKGMRLHRMNKHSLKYNCQICKKEFSSSRGRSIHMRDSHDSVVDLKKISEEQFDPKQIARQMTPAGNACMAKIKVEEERFNEVTEIKHGAETSHEVCMNEGGNEILQPTLNILHKEVVEPSLIDYQNLIVDINSISEEHFDPIQNACQLSSVIDASPHVEEEEYNEVIEIKWEGSESSHEVCMNKGNKIARPALYIVHKEEAKKETAENLLSKILSKCVSTKKQALKCPVIWCKFETSQWPDLASHLDNVHTI